IIFRAHMEKIDENLLYWRGVVLDYFDGASWKGSYKAAMDKNAKLSIPGRRIEQTIYLEPYENRYFFTLDKPLSLSLPHARRYSDLSYSQPEDITGRTRYQVISIPSSLLPEKEIDRDVYLQLPDRNFEKIKETVKGISSGKDKEATVKAILTFLRSGNYKYSLQNLPVTSDPLDDFLFKYRYGNCEYFASAMAVMLRIADIPSRIVGGYKGGYYNEMGRYYFVPQRNAHVWVEAYLENKGWVRVDPTPGGIESYVSYMRRGLLFRMRLLFDTINYYWNAAVINYDFEGQMALFGKLRSGIRKPDIRISFTKERIIRYSIFVSVAASSLFMVYFLALRTRNAEERLIASFLKKMGSLGYTKAKSEGLEEFVSKIEDSLRKEKAYNFVREFEKYYYLDTKLSKKEVRNLKQLIKNI
ncbi:MAG: DUF3488 domain-containing protein, partial [Nitrospirae bacterium]|nr:DUF3488 domain-containing protein [Nitrospirota bacterium]